MGFRICSNAQRWTLEERIVADCKIILSDGLGLEDKDSKDFSRRLRAFWQ